MEVVLKRGYYRSLLGYINVDWFVNEVTYLENNFAFSFKNTKKVIIMTKIDEEEYRNKTICRFCEKKIECGKVRDHCHFTGDFRGPAHRKCNIIVTQKQSLFTPSTFHNFSIYDCFRFFEILVDKKNHEVKFDFLPKTSEEYISVTYGCIRFIDGYQFLSSSLVSLVKTLVDNSLETFKDFEKEILDNDEFLNIVFEVKILIKEDK